MGLGRMPNHVPKFSEQARAARVGGSSITPPTSGTGTIQN